MQNAKVIIGILALMLCAFLAMVFWPEKPEPVYKGKKLSEWVISTGTSPASFFNREALREIGTNGIPFYLKWIRYERTGFGDFIHARMSWLAHVTCRFSSIMAGMFGGSHYQKLFIFATIAPQSRYSFVA